MWPLEVDVFAKPPRHPRFAPMASLEVRVPLSPQLAVLMSWVDEPDAHQPVAAHRAYAAEMDALIIGQRDKQWMHRPGDEPPVAATPIRPLSRAFEGRYPRMTVEASRRRQTTAQYVDRVSKRRFLDDIDIVNIS